MILVFYKLYLTCLKYDFSFVLDSEGYKSNHLKIILKPYDKSGKAITIIESNYRRLFIKAISEMKEYRKVRR